MGGAGIAECDRVLHAILGGDSEGLREILHNYADRRVPHLALAQALLLKDQQYSTACLAVLLEHHSGADHVDEPGLLAKAGNSDFPPVIKSRMDDLEWEEIEAFGGAYKLAPIHLAAARGLLEACQMLARAGADLHALDIRGSSPLSLASAFGDVGTVSFFLAQGARTSQRDNQGNTALHLAAEQGNHEVVSLLLDHGASPLALNEKGKWPLLVAVEKCRIACVEVLSKCFTATEMNMVHSGDLMHSEQWTALHYAASAGDVACVRTLLRYGANVRATSTHGDTALHVARNAQVVHQLVRKDKQLIKLKNNAGMTPLSRAVLHSQPCVVDALLHYGSEPDSRDASGCTPLHHFAADLPCSNHNVLSVVDVKMEACCGKLACMGLLLDAGADVNAVDDSGSTPLHHALKKYRLDSVRYLLRRGALPGPRNNAGETPLEVADQQQILQCVLAFVQAGVQPQNVHPDTERVKERVVSRGEPAFINSLTLLREAGWVSCVELCQMCNTGSPNSQWWRMKEVVPLSLDLVSLSRANVPVAFGARGTSSNLQLPSVVRKYLQFEDYVSLITGNHFTYWGLLEGKTRPRSVNYASIRETFSKPRPSRPR
nr:hypothetical protein BaRGS_020964 [Batillaria attramentaria]